MSDILDGLTDRQREAVTHIDGPLLVVAGAGSGKTRVITRRVGHLASAGVPAYRILAITFTNKAAEEMKRRVEQLTGARGAWISTFHSLCARMLRQFSDLLGFENPFTIYDRADSLACVKSVVAELNLRDSKISPGSFLAAISRFKNEMLTPADAAERAAGYRAELEAKVYGRYDELCRRNNALDFDDLLLRTAQLLQAQDHFRAYWQSRFQYILIDEYQDTNRPQYVIAHELAEPHHNLCATGDPDQSIYAWRGADIQNILDFEKDYPDARVVKLEENFRSTQMILMAASGVIEHNKARIERGLWTKNDKGVRVQVIESVSDVDEGDAIAEGIRTEAGEGIPYGEMAVFYRTHAQSRAIEDALRDAGIPYTILDAVEFYNRKEIKDAVAYLKVIVNPADSVSLLRVINEPKRGIGDRTIDQVAAHAGMQGITLTDAIASAGSIPGLSARAAKTLGEFSAMMGKLRELPRRPVADVLRAVLAATGYLAGLKQSKAEEDEARVQNVEELVNAAADFDLDYPDGGLEQFLEKVTLVSDSDTVKSKEGSVTLMTLHSAKGLEFSAVFIAGVQEGLLPHLNAFGSTTRIEEERRLCYVGMTRAKRRLRLHWAAERFTYGQIGVASASRFIKEIPAKAKEYARGAAGREEASAALEAAAEETERERVVEYEPGVDEYEGGLRVNERVRHPSFGEGRVLSISGRGAMTTAVIDFRGRKRHLMVQFANLTRVGR